MIKLIAVDMDGTFLNDEKRYNQARFAAQYQQLKQQGIRFVVASGNQYWQLRSFFPQIVDEISFVAENGAYIVSEGEELFCAAYTPAQVETLIRVLRDQPSLTPVFCGKNSAWVHESAPDSLISIMSRHYHRLQKVSDLCHIDDTLFKVALNLPDEQIPDLLPHFGHALDGIAHPVTSGFGFIDLIIPGVHKAHGLALLQQRWGILHSEVVALGDSGNDAEMLQQAGFSFAMSHARPEIRSIARFSAGSNNEEGVLNVIDALLQRQPPF